MRLAQEHIKLDDRIEVVAQKQEARELEHVARLKLHKGHKCFELNVITKEIKEAQFENTFVALSENMSGVNRRVIINDYCVYATALNKENAAKHFLKMLSNMK